MLEHLLQFRSLISVGNINVSKKKYDLRSKYNEDIDSFIIRYAIPEKNIILYQQVFYSNILIKKVITQLM